MANSPENKGSDSNNDHAGVSNTSEQTDASASATDDENNEDVVYRNCGDRPVYKLSVQLIDTYKHINKVYYEAKAKRLSEQKDQTRGGVHNDGYDDQNYDYILQGDEIVNDRYILKHKMGKVCVFWFQFGIIELVVIFLSGIFWASSLCLRSRK
jgi:hypothetical protein